MNVQLNPADILRRSADVFGVVRHFGIYLGDGRVLHNVPIHGEHVTSLDSFGRGRKIFVEKIPEHQRDFVLRNAAEILRDPDRYSLLRNNCEHTVYRAVSGSPESPQLWNLAAMMIMVVGFALVLKPSR